MKSDDELPVVVRRIERVRILRGMTKKTLSLAVTNGDYESYWGATTATGKVPGADKLEAIADALDVSPLMFFADFENIEPMNSALKKIADTDSATLARVMDLIARERGD